MSSPACEHAGATLALSQTYVFMFAGWKSTFKHK